MSILFTPQSRVEVTSIAPIDTFEGIMAVAKDAPESAVRASRADYRVRMRRRQRFLGFLAALFGTDSADASHERARQLMDAKAAGR